MKNKRQIGFMLTPLGLLGREAIDALTLYMYKIEKNAIVLQNGELNFIKVELVNGNKKEEGNSTDTKR